MVTFELVEFIKNQLETKISREDISHTLSVAGGWKHEHIAQAFFLAEYGYHIKHDGQFLD